ncbi:MULTISPECIES: LuxE/PaaK family acyltransferase [unclassified Caballeronia]|jgi:phenylacetate-coenzyme A ligase PaaK-like adenylate-forming protein|uniref:LuxE/PaaK family acyltransferase n=1 Tax=unclassified Caballeronia TaxID=2646786 RepID=UPI002028BCE7|nr:MULTISPECIES: acyl-protein synthetase [unclassified Caballeronia]MDR5772914.1 acyl-protein synthetase [Caballeronia sp. LZ002]MDR5803623.1 acyl-protein synthetase [Caballeronia sp. LZ001]MDR5848348.1 acyl-protein synthetase [Caballeronia sp. LZ003]
MSGEPVVSDVLQWPVYGMPQSEKDALLGAELRRLTALHYEACPPYRAMLDKLASVRTAHGESTPNALDDLPFLPVRLFKHEQLVSVPHAEVVKTMTSSGTSGQNVSQIFLDRKTSMLQVKVLSRIVGDLIGPKRLPMLVIDCRATIANRYRFSARTAGIQGFSMFGRDVEFALDDDMSLNLERVRAWLDKHADEDILVFGFTFVVWLHLVRALEDAGETLPLERGVLVHGGGWKQLQSQAVDGATFRRRVGAITNLARVHSYYGMVEQTGSIFVECEHGHLHASAWSDIRVRDPIDFRPLQRGGRGLIQLLSTLPHSYPGHSLLSEDEGEIVGIDDCPCGRKGTYFAVHGRIQHAEARGCSDTYTR